MCNDPVQLARRAAQGDKEAFGDLVSLHQAAIFNVACRLLGDAAEAEDATQETFIRAYRSLKSFDPQRPLVPWLKRIAVNLCLDRLRRPAALSLAEDVLASNPGPESQTVQREHSLQVQAALLGLPPRFRAVIELRHFQEMSYEQIAETLKCPVNTVRTELFRARKLLAMRLKDLK